jgi:hypothetical protein
VGFRVFQIGSIDYNQDFIDKTVSILDLGFKFVPCWHLNSTNVFSSLLKNIDNAF